MGYDLDSARKAGIPDAEIIDTLAQVHNYDLAGARAAGIADTEILNALASRQKPAEPVIERESPELFGYTGAGLGAIGAAGDVIYSKGRPLIRAGEKLMGMEPSGPPKVKPRTFQDPSAVAQGAIERRTPVDLPEGTTTTVRNWTAGRPGEGAGQHAGEFLGGSNYSEADKFAKERAAFEAANPTMKVQPGSRLAIPEQDAEAIAKQRAALQAQANATNQAEVNAVAQNRAARLQERDMLRDQANRKNMLTGSANVVGKVALPIMGGYEAGAQGTQAYNRLTRPDLTGSDVAAGATNLLGSAAGMRSMFPGKARIPAAIISQGAGAIANFLDKRNPRNEPEEQTAPGMAMGGSVTPNPKLKSLSDFLDQLMQQATAAPAPAPAPMAPPQGGMPPGMPGMPPGMPPQQPPMQQPPMQQSPLSSMMPQMAGGGKVGALGSIAKKGLELSKKFNYDPYKMSQQYPDVIPPVLAVDAKTGKEFMQKQLSPEALEVQKARKFAQKQIDAGNYQPFFDVEKRFYADPSHYPTAGYTATDIVPKKADTIAKYEALANDPEALARLRGAFEKAKDRPAAKDWYAMGQLEQEFIKEFGPVEGRKQFKARFADAMAATTGGADPNSNLMMAAFTNYQKGLGQEIPTKAADLPFPIGGRFVSGNMEQAKKLAEMGEIPVTNPKRHNFSANFLGHRDVSTLDEQMSQLWDPKMMSPPPNAYGIYQQALAKEAKKAGVQPANFQDIAWAGAKDYPGKPMMQEINEMIERTHAITGEPKEEILKGFIRGNKPMYGIGAGSVGGLGALQEEKQ
jgi:hypothetical protein